MIAYKNVFTYTIVLKFHMKKHKVINYIVNLYIAKLSFSHSFREFIYFNLSNHKIN